MAGELPEEQLARELAKNPDKTRVIGLTTRWWRTPMKKSPSPAGEARSMVLQRYMTDTKTPYQIASIVYQSFPVHEGQFLNRPERVAKTLANMYGFEEKDISKREVDIGGVKAWIFDLNDIKKRGTWTRAVYVLQKDRYTLSVARHLWRYWHSTFYETELIQRQLALAEAKGVRTSWLDALPQLQLGELIFDGLAVGFR